MDGKKKRVKALNGTVQLLQINYPQIAAALTLHVARFPYGVCTLAFHPIARHRQSCLPSRNQVVSVMNPIRRTKRFRHRSLITNAVPVPGRINTIFPDEVLGHIFVDAIESLEHDLVGDESLEHFVGDSVMWRRVTEAWANKKHTTPCVLRSVCRKWRALVDSTPQAWTTLKFHRKLPDGTVAIDAIFAQSKSCKIDIFLNVYHCLLNANPKSCEYFFTMLEKHSARIRAIVLDLGDTCFRSERRRLLSRLTSVLHQMEIKILGIYQFSDQRLDGLLDVPGLEALILRDSVFNISFFSKDTLASLRHLTIPSRMISLLPTLSTTLSLETISFMEDKMGISRLEGIVALPTVKHVKLPLDPDILRVLSGHLRLPALTSLEIHEATDHRWGVRTALRLFAGFINQPLPELTSFRLSFVRFHYAGLQLIADILRLMPHVAILGLRSCFIGGILRMLTVDLQSPVLIPMLTTLILHDVETVGLVERLRPFYNSRTAQDSFDRLGIQTLGKIRVVDKRVRDFLEDANIPVVEEMYLSSYSFF